MISKAQYKENILSITPGSFEELAISLFRYQAEHNPVYRQFLELNKVSVEQVSSPEQIPFLPIEFFKTQEVITGAFEPTVVYQSSGTTQHSRSRHLLPEDEFYKTHAQKVFELFYGPVTDYIFFALLPSYLEQGHSSLVAMVDHFIHCSGQELSGFYLYNLDQLLTNIQRARASGKKIMLFGVTYALLDLAEAVVPGSLEDVIFMETGGMKGRRREMIRAELHAILSRAFGVKAIHSEYGMTELLSQAYSQGQGLFRTPPAMRVLLRDPNDPFTVSSQLQSGGINVIDLANVDSCAFIETKDIGRLHPDGSFEVLGRFDNSDVRGCNLLIA